MPFDIKQILYNLPEVKKPIEKKISFNTKLKWTLIVLGAFFILANITLYGLSRNALEQFESLAPDVAILDIGMPRVTGYDVAQALRGRDVQVPLIALTGWGQASDRDRAIAAGFDHHLVKPVAIPSLVRLLASLERGERTSDTRPAESSRA